MTHLILCSTCHRHVRDQEVECPFCHAAISAESRDGAVRSPAPAGIPRAKLYAVGAAVAAGVAAVACGGDDTTGTSQTGGTSGTAQAGGSSGSAQSGGAAGSSQSGGAAGDAVADSGATGGQGGTAADAKPPVPDGPIAHPYGCVFPDPSRTTKV